MKFNPFIIAILVLGLLLYQLNNVLDLPVVERHYPSKKCVRVLTPQPSGYTCDNLPNKYEVVWVTEDIYP